MKSHWWSCVLGLLCMPAEVILGTWTVSQSPSSTSQIKVNSSTTITCSISPNAMGLYLRGAFHKQRSITFISLDKGEISKDTTAADFQGRIQVTKNRNFKEGIELTLQLSLLGLSDTDLYYCEWNYINLQSGLVSLSSNGTILIVTENDPQEQCSYQIFDHILIALSVAAFVVVLFLLSGAMILQYRRFKMNFRPARDIPPRPRRPQHVCPQQSNQHYPYCITAANNTDYSLY